jgi:arylsulfatase
MMKRLLCQVALAALIGAPLSAQGTTASSPQAAFKTFPAQPRAPKGAPNVLVVMTDDVGYAATSTFGGPVPMPNYDSIAAGGLRYNSFYTASMCSPTRAALLTGRNHHRVGFGSLGDVAVDEPGYNGVFPASAATIGQVLKANGYDTSWFGKNHNTPPWENTPFGPFDRWPIGLGFDYFYGFHGAGTDQFAPNLIENVNTIRPFVGKPDYVLDRDLADHAIQWIRLRKSVHPDRPFLIYYAPGTAHGPTQAPKEWIEKFRGKFDQGWDKLHQEIFQRQKAMGIIPKNARANARPRELPAWDTLTPEQKRVSARMMEVHAAQLAFFDTQMGRVTDELKRLGEYDNTLIIYIQGDNGASQELGPVGSNNTPASMNNNEPSWRELAGKIDSFGGPQSFGVYQAGWAFALDTPFQWSKEIASHLGGLKDGMVVSWPKRIAAKGEVRQQFTHAVDIAPTIYEAIGIRPPAEVNGKPQMPLDGVSFAYSFTQADAPSRHTEQYFEMLGHRAFYKDGWIASTTPPQPSWIRAPASIPAEKYAWELYNLNDDFSQSIDLAKKYPEKLAELRRGFDAAAKANNVYPFLTDFMGRLNGPAGRPSILGGAREATYYPGPARYTPGMFPAFGPNPWTATATVDVPAGGADGTLVAQGGWAIGWGLFVVDGKPVFFYRGSDHDPDVRIEGATPLAPGRHVIEGRLVPGGPGSPGAELTLAVDGTIVGTQRSATRWTFIGQPGAVGITGDQQVLPGHQPPFAYGGALDNVRIAVGERKP